jgi:NADPH:quinone reductase-like Zn-dependent oxidoreductase
MKERARTADVTIPTTMRAAYQSGYGRQPHEVVSIEEMPVPTPGDGQVLIEVSASSTNALDWHFMTGLPYFIRLQAGMSTPKKRPVPGADASGRVVALGSGVSDFAIGDEVFGDIGGGGFAEYAVAPARVLAKRPANLGIEESATLGVAALTALQGLRDWAGLEPGDRVLVNGGSGGVGSFAIQIAKALGADHVTAVCSTANVAAAAELGADRVVDYKKDDFTLIDEKFDVFFDNAGSTSLGSGRRMLTENGVFVMVTGKKGKWFRPADRMLAGATRSKFWSQRFVSRTAEPSGDDERVLAGMVEAGLVTPLIDRRFDLDQIVEALAHQSTGHARGKTIVTVS